MKERVGRIWKRLPLAAWIFCGGALANRLLVADEWPVFSTIYYAASPHVISLVALVAAGILAIQKRRNAALVTLACAVSAGLGALVHSTVRAAPAPEPPAGAIRGLFWNVERGVEDWAQVERSVLDLNPDVAWFVEAEGHKGGGRPWNVSLPGYECRTLQGGLTAITRGRFLQARNLPLDGGQMALVEVEIGGRRFTSLVVDIIANPFRHRARAIAQVDALRATLSGPLLIVGDFNTPRDSALFGRRASLLSLFHHPQGRLRSAMRHAFETAGSGIDGTWPQPLPFLPIDHAWGSPHVRFHACTHVPAAGSDHRALLFRFSLQP